MKVKPGNFETFREKDSELTGIYENNLRIGVLRRTNKDLHIMLSHMSTLDANTKLLSLITFDGNYRWLA